MTKLGSPSNGFAYLSKKSNNSEILSYPEICELMELDHLTLENDSEQMVSYAFNHKYWIGFDGIEGIKLKVITFV